MSPDRPLNSISIPTHRPMTETAFAVPTPDCAVCPGSYHYNDPSKKSEGRTSDTDAR
jgi:hypothetical protein